MRNTLLAGLAALAVASIGWADILTLRNGDQRTGRFISGSRDSIVFQDDSGNRRTYQRTDVRSLTFDDLQARTSASGIRTDNTSTIPAGTRTIPAGTDLVVRTDQAIEVTDESQAGKTYPAQVDRDIRDSAGSVLVPKGSEAELIVRSVNEGGATGSRELALDLQSLRVGNQRYLISTADLERANERGLGRNRRTAEMVGGGAVLGTVLGAIAGGGKGAAIGAVAGAAAGAGAQVLTRGKEVKIPAESTLTFRLDQPVQLVPR